MAKAPRSAKPASETHELMQAKLASSGLTVEAAIKLGLEPVLDASRLHQAFDPVPAIKFNYYHPTQPTKLLQCRPKWPGFYRLRYLKQVFDFNTQTEAKPKRYVQEPDTGCCAYFPKLVEWAKLLPNWEAPLIITEGELKAAKACLEGFPTVGLGGVHNFRSTKAQVPFLDELQGITWARRAVYLVYDSDFRINPHVVGAINQLAEELLHQGALPHYVALPDVYDDPEQKTGLDDFLVARGPEELRLLLGQAQPLTLSQALWRLNEQVVYVQDPGLVVVRGTGQKLAPGAFKEHAFSQETSHELHLKEDGSVKLKRVAAAPAWLRWPFRHEASKLTYAPGQPELTRGCYNTWPGWGCEPKKGDVRPWLKLLDHLFTGAEPEARRHFERWCAYPLQHPGTKLFSSYVVHGVMHGTGKSLLGHTLSKIYGKNYAKINQRDLERDYNDWAENKQFVMGEEITGSNKRTEADALKDLITQQEIRINGKYVPIYTVPDVINYLFTSNHPDAFFLEDNDRRFNIHEVAVGPMDDDFYVEYLLWLDSQPGPAALFYHLLQLDLGDFNPAARALMTAAKERMIMDSKSDLGAWVHQLLQAPEQVLKFGDVTLAHDLYTNKQLLELYDPVGRTKVSAQGLGNALKKAGARQVLQGRPVRIDGQQDRYYIVRHAERWLDATSEQVIKHLQPAEAPQKKGRKY